MLSYGLSALQIKVCKAHDDLRNDRPLSRQGDPVGIPMQVWIYRVGDITCIEARQVLGHACILDIQPLFGVGSRPAVARLPTLLLLVR